MPPIRWSARAILHSAAGATGRGAAASRYMARDLGVAEREQVQVRQNGAARSTRRWCWMKSVPKGCAWIPAGLCASVALGRQLAWWLSNNN